MGSLISYLIFINLSMQSHRGYKVTTTPWHFYSHGAAATAPRTLHRQVEPHNLPLKLCHGTVAHFTDMWQIFNTIKVSICLINVPRHLGKMPPVCEMCYGGKTSTT